MSISIFGALVLLLGPFLSRSGVLRAQTLLLVLGGTSALTLTALGGAQIVVPVLCLPFLVLRAWTEALPAGGTSTASRATFWLGATALWGVLLAFLAPRLLPSSIFVMSLSRGEKAVTKLLPLAPGSGNVTQSVYAVGALAAFAATRWLLRRPERMQQFRDAAIGLAMLNCLAGALNVIEHYTHMPSVLVLLRTAYAQTEQQLMGMPRIQGTFPETSAYSTFTLMLIAFTLNLWIDGVRVKQTATTTALLFAFLALSTSGTAYAGMSLYGAIFSFSLLRRVAQGERLPRFVILLSFAILGFVVIGTLIIFEAPFMKRITNLLDIVVVNKMGSTSGEERSSWNSQGLANFIDSWGLGLGFGTVRTSSFAVTLLSNLGVLGTATYLAFLKHVVFSRSSVSHDRAMNRACQHAVVAGMCAACVSATVFDLGVGFYMFAAAASLGGGRG